MTRRSATVSGMRKRRRSKFAKASTKKQRRKSTPIAELRAQMSAASHVQELIGRSPSDLQPVFDAIAENARELTGALYSGLARLEDGIVKVEATSGWDDEALAAINRSYPRPAGRDNLLAAAMIDGEVQNVADILATDVTYTSELQAISGYRSMLIVPMMREQNPIGAIVVFSRQVGVFQPSHIDLLKTFAAQAVIAIENARLLSELRQRTADLTERTADLAEALDQQTATSEVLQVISSQPGHLEPVFAKMLENAVRICNAKFGNIHRWDGAALHLVATHNTPPAFAEIRSRSPFRPGPQTPTGRMLTTKTMVHIADLAADRAYTKERVPLTVAAVEVAGIRTVLCMPMLKEYALVGAFILSRQEVRPFTDKQIALVQNFAAQAVIAIENARLLTELRDRTEEVEKLNQHLERRVTDQVGEIERMGRLRRFLPPQVA
jgi:GAF domain-containing protein